MRPEIGGLANIHGIAAEWYVSLKLVHQSQFAPLINFEFRLKTCLQTLRVVIFMVVSIVSSRDNEQESLLVLGWLP